MYTGNLVAGLASILASGTKDRPLPPTVTAVATVATRAPVAGPAADEAAPEPAGATAAPTDRAERSAAVIPALPGIAEPESHISGAGET
jgi:hypothetical protein